MGQDSVTVDFSGLLEEQPQRELVEPMIFFEKETAKREAEPNSNNDGVAKTANAIPNRFTGDLGMVSPFVPTVSQPVTMQPIFEMHGIGLPRGGEAVPPIVEGGKVTPYATMRKLLERRGAILRVLDNRLYFYTGKYYKALDKMEFGRVVMALCRGDVALMGSSKLANEAYSLLMIEPEILVSETAVDNHNVPFQNYLVDLNSGLLTPHSPCLFVTYCLDSTVAEREENMYCPNFFRFLDQVAGGDKNLVQRILEIVGYCLTPDTSAKAIFLFQGVPNSGKSVLCSLLQSFFRGNFSTLNAHELKLQFALSDLEGKMLCISPDMPSDPLDTTAVSNLKKLSGNDIVSADRKFNSRSQFGFRGKIVLTTNNPLLVKHRDIAFEDRIVTVPFKFSVPKEEQNNDLLRIFEAEKPGIAWQALQAYFNLRRNSYRFTGDYTMNAVVADGDFYDAGNVPQKVIDFVRRNYKKQSDGVVYMEEAYMRFVPSYGEVPYNYFASLFIQMTSQLLGATKGRKYKPDAENATSCVKGIALKEMSNSEGSM